MIKIEELKIKFKDKILLDNFSCEFKESELTVIYGKSGSGKTTLLNIIGMLENNYEGKVYIYDYVNCSFASRKGRKVLRENIGFIFQNYGLIDNNTVLKNLEVGIYFKKNSKKEKLQMMKDCLKNVGLEDKLYEKVYKLSGGEQQRVALARIILKNPNIILADEPTGSLDYENKKIVMESLMNMRKLGKTVIVVTHDKDFKEVADKCIEL